MNDNDVSLSKEQKKLVIELFNLGKNLGNIRTEVFSHIYDEKPTVRVKRYSYVTLRLLDREKQRRINDEILDALGFSGWDQFSREREKILQRKGYSPAFNKAKKLVHERDGRKCQVTGDTDNLHIHHINRDKENNNLWNLITITQRVHKSIEHNLWKSQTKVIFGSLQWHIIVDSLRYVECLRERGYPNSVVRARVILPGFFYTPYDPEKERELEEIEKPIRSFSSIQQLDEFIEEGKKRQSALINEVLHWQHLGETGKYCANCALWGGQGASYLERCSRSKAIDFVCEEWKKSPDWINGFYTRFAIEEYNPSLTLELVEFIID